MKYRDFFRESAWVMASTVIGGSMMWGVHFLSKKIPEADYAGFVTLNAVLTLVPAIPLQMVFARWTAKALALNRPGQVASLLRIGLIGLFLAWLPIGVSSVVFGSHIKWILRLDDWVSVVLTAISVLTALFYPLVLGVLQGSQRFLWFGLGQIVAGAGRFSIALLLVLTVFSSLRGIMIGVLVGYLLALIVTGWGAKDYFCMRGQHVNWRKFASETLPIVFAFAGFQFLFSADVIFLKAKADPTEMAYYSAAGVLARGLVWFVGPMAAVMFPKVVHFTVKSEKTRLLEVTLALTFSLAAVGAVVLYTVGQFVVALVYKSSYCERTLALLPMYLIGMTILSLVNVLVNNLVASGRYAFVVPLLGLCGVYAYLLDIVGNRMEQVLKILIGVGLVALLICGSFTWLDKGRRRTNVNPALA